VAIHLLAKKIPVNAVFTFNAFVICAAPSVPMRLSVYFSAATKEFDLKRERNTIHSPQKSIRFNVLFNFNASAIQETPASPISLPN